MRFTDALASAFPESNPLPPLLLQTLRFLEDQGCVRTARNGEPYMTVYPDQADGERAIMAFGLPDPQDSARWTGSEDPAVNERLVIFLRTGGDGSHAGLWRDDEGRQRIVHLGSGSGSVMLCVLAWTVEDLLRLLAIGYDELCWPDHFDETPDEVRDIDDEEDDYPPPPFVFRDYVENTLGLEVPERASDIVREAVSMDAEASTDPFWNWLKGLQEQTAPEG